jgi:hypothetical protein
MGFDLRFRAFLVRPGEREQAPEKGTRMLHQTDQLERAMRREAAKLMGESRSKAKRVAARANGRRGGSKPRYPKCPRYYYHQFRKGKCAGCGMLQDGTWPVEEQKKFEVKQKQSEEEKILEQWKRFDQRPAPGYGE